MTFRSLWLTVAAPIAVALAAGPLAAQDDPATMLTSSQRSLVTRAELTATLDSIDRILKAGGYSSAFRDSKRVEAEAIRQRLADGDLHTGDPVLVTVIDDESLSKAYVVTPARTLLLAGTIEISVKGVLRSELESYVKTKLKTYLRGEPTVRVTTSIRIQLSGAVAKVGFFNVPAGMPLTEVLMNPSAGGGVSNSSRFEKSTVLRGDKVIVDARAFKTALATAKTLDELNLQAGDEIKVASKTGSVFTKVLAVTSALGGLIYLGVQVF